jgi:uncharacterized protein YecT (DUF1311 family)
MSARQAAREEPACLRVCEGELTTAGQRECLSRERDVAKRQLDAAVAAVESHFANAADIDKSIPATFRKAQAAWDVYYTADCAAVSAEWAGGSGARGAVLFCGVVHLRRRTYDLWSTYDLEGSMPLPVMVCSDQRSGA